MPSGINKGDEPPPVSLLPPNDQIKGRRYTLPPFLQRRSLRLAVLQ
jgi:hypothetical protein